MRSLKCFAVSTIGFNPTNHYRSSGLTLLSFVGFCSLHIFSCFHFLLLLFELMYPAGTSQWIFARSNAVIVSSFFELSAWKLGLSIVTAMKGIHERREQLLTKAFPRRKNHPYSVISSSASLLPCPKNFGFSRKINISSHVSFFSM